MQNRIQQEVWNFKGVMDKRKAPGDFTSLFDKLALSAKFSEEAKPYCLAELLLETERRLFGGGPFNPMIAPKDVMVALDSLCRTGLAKRARAVLPEAVRMKAFGKFVSAVFNFFSFSEEEVYRRFQLVESNGLSESMAQTLDYLFMSGVPEDHIGSLCDFYRAHQCRLGGDQVPQPIADAIIAYKAQEAVRMQAIEDALMFG